MRETDIPIYTSLYETFGKEGLLKRANINATYALKLQIVQDDHEHSLSLAAIIIKYGVSRASVHRWSHIVRTQGYEVLSTNKPRGRPPKA